MGEHTAGMPRVTTSGVDITRPDPNSKKRWAVFAVITWKPEPDGAEVVFGYESHGIISQVGDWERKFFTPEHGFIIVSLPDVGEPAAGWDQNEVDVDRKLADHEALLGMSNKDLKALPPRKVQNDD